MNGNDLDYADILRRWNRTREQAANDLERYLLRGEVPDLGCVAQAVVTLRTDLQPVIRCRDCKYYCPEIDGELEHCTHPSGYVGECAKLFFCASGERKEAGE